MDRVTRARDIGRLRWVLPELLRQESEEYPVEPAATTPVGAPAGPLPGEPGLLEQTMRGEVVAVALGLDSVHPVVAERVPAGEQDCGRGDAGAAAAGQDHEPRQFADAAAAIDQREREATETLAVVRLDDQQAPRAGCRTRSRKQTAQGLLIRSPEGEERLDLRVGGQRREKLQVLIGGGTQRDVR